MRSINFYVFRNPQTDNNSACALDSGANFHDFHRLSLAINRCILWGIRVKAGYFAVMPMKAWISEWRMLYIRAVSGQNEDETIEQIISHDASPGYT